MLATEAEAALKTAVEHLGTNPARVEQVGRERNRLQDCVEELFRMVAPDAIRKQDVLVRAALLGRDAVVEQLLAANVDPDAVASESETAGGLDGWTALTACVIGGHMLVLELLLGKDADIEKAERGGDRPLMLAALRGQAACVERLLEAGASFNAQNKDGHTALTCAVSNGHQTVVKALLQAKCDVDLPDNLGNTPLMVAAYHNRLYLLKMLLEANANKGMGDMNGRTALQLAEECDHTETVNTLLMHDGPSDCAENAQQQQKVKSEPSRF